MGKTENTENEIMQLKWLRYQKPKDENIGWTKQRMPCVLLPKKKFSWKNFVYFRTAENSGFVNSKLGIWSDKHVKKHTIHTPRDVSNLTMIKKIMVLRYDTYLMLLPKHRVQIINYLPTL